MNNITATSIGKKRVKESDFQTQISEAYSICIHAINSAPQTWGRAHISVAIDPSIPPSFGKEHVNDARKIIIMSVIKKLEAAEFTVMLELKEKTNYLHIVWEVNIDQEEIKAINNFINAHVIKQKDVEDFISGAGGFAGKTNSAIPKTGQSKSTDKRKIKKSGKDGKEENTDEIVPPWADDVPSGKS